MKIRVEVDGTVVVVKRLNDDGSQTGVATHFNTRGLDLAWMKGMELSEVLGLVNIGRGVWQGECK